jgi:AcrR family transcriptional regulator
MVNLKTTPAKLGRQDWIQAGLTVLSESGVEAVRVEPLAKMMQVTKGSFYWHFKDRQDLLTALLEEWVKLGTSIVIEEMDQLAADPQTKLLRLFEIAVENAGLPDDRVEKAIRAWANNDPNVAALLAQIDQQRLDYTQECFLQLGFSPQAALVRARMAYYTLVVGELATTIPTNLEERLAEARMQHQILTRREA